MKPGSTSEARPAALAQPEIGEKRVDGVEQPEIAPGIEGCGEQYRLRLPRSLRQAGRDNIRSDIGPPDLHARPRCAPARQAAVKSRQIAHSIEDTRSSPAPRGSIGPIIVGQEAVERADGAAEPGGRDVCVNGLGLVSDVPGDRAARVPGTPQGCDQYAPAVPGWTTGGSGCRTLSRRARRQFDGESERETRLTANGGSASGRGCHRRRARVPTGSSAAAFRRPVGPSALSRRRTRGASSPRGPRSPVYRAAEC
jgi:hypothetical protein